MTITFYDIPSAVGPWSPNTWKIRFCLNMKNIPYTTEWVELQNIERICKEKGIPQASLGRSGQKKYTLPAIHDSSTGIYMSESTDIAEYLEEKYPDGPAIFPDNTIGIQIDFEDLLNKHLAAMWDFVIPEMVNHLDGEHHTYYRILRESWYGKPLEDVVPRGERGATEWRKVERGMAEMAKWYTKVSGPFIMGDHPCWTDFVVGGHLIWFNKAWGDDDEKWKTLLNLNNGIWKNLLASLKPHMSLY